MTKRWLLLLVPLLLAIGAVAATPDLRGWSQGQPAANAARVLGPLEREVHLELPAELQAKVDGPTLIVYFSPTCPHCLHVTPELVALSKRLEGTAQVIGVSTGRQPKSAIDEYVATYAVPFPIVHDQTGRIAQSLSVSSTPSAVYVVPDKKKSKVIDFWYPYQPGYDLLVEMRALPQPWDAFRKHEYVGNAACGTCHTQEADSWALTHHSIAWQTLVAKKETANPACVGCHVTGNGRPTGYDGHADSPLVNVGCESCHGPAGPHDGERTAAETTCAECHDAKHSIGFTYARALPLIDHYQGNALDEAAWLAKRTALAKGELPRRMVGFAEGTTVGAAACKGCHEAEHRHWSGDQHAGAMALLEGDKAKEVGCVRCHATALEAGPPPTELAGFRVDEGVGCESCHGPGEAHVAAGGGKGNIEGLGEDCPVCVIEALCTSCHTTEWDPDWDLDRDLPRVGHTAHP